MASVRARHGPAQLPRVRPIVADALADFLRAKRGADRPPHKAATLLALIVELHKRGLPFPSRQAVADAVGCSVQAVDYTLGVYLAEGWLDQAVGVREGNVAKFPSVVRDRFYVPSQELQDALKNIQRRM